MMINRNLIRFLSLALAVTFCVTAAKAQFFTGTATTQIAPNIYDFRFGATHSLWIEMDESVIVIDTINTEAAAKLKESIAAVTDKPVSHVIYSHEHYDHISGAQIFADAGAEILSHANCLDTFDYVPNPDAIKPTMTFTGDRYDVAVAGTKIELLYFGRNHGDCMVVPHFPEHRLIMMVDMLSDKRLPFGSLPDYYPGDMVRTLQEVSDLDFDRIARGHGGVVGRDVLAGTLAYWSDLMTAVKAELDQGKGAFDVMANLELPQYREWANYDRWFRLHVERAVWHYAIGW